MRTEHRRRRRHLLFTALVVLSASVAAQAREVSLIDAVKNGDAAAVRGLLRTTGVVNIAGGDGMTALHWAAYGGDVDVAQLLVEAGADVNVRSTRGATPLLLAADNADAWLVALLLKAGADPNAANPLGTTALMRSAAAGDVDSVTALLEGGADVNARETAHQHTALMFAAARGRTDVLRLLAASGADLNAISRTVENTTNLVDEDGNPIPAESRTGRTQRQQKGDGLALGLGGRTALHYTAREGFVEAARALVTAGADIDLVDPLDGSSALVVAIANGHFDLAAELLERGANPNLAMKDGVAPLYAVLETQWSPVSWTPTAFTAANGIVQQETDHLALVRALLARGADPNARISKTVWFSPPHHNITWARTIGATPFWRAAQANDIPAMRLLAEWGADPTAASSDKTTPLAVAAGVGWAGNFSTTAPDAFLAATRYLVEEVGLDVNVANTAGYTPLMGAAWRGDNTLIRYLVEKGARLDATTTRGWSATDMANGPFIRGTQVPVQYPQSIALLKSLGAPDLLTAEDERLGGGRATSGRRGGRESGDDADADADEAKEAKEPPPASSTPAGTGGNARP